MDEKPFSLTICSDGVVEIGFLTERPTAIEAAVRYFTSRGVKLDWCRVIYQDDLLWWRAVIRNGQAVATYPVRTFGGAGCRYRLDAHQSVRHESI